MNVINLKEDLSKRFTIGALYHCHSQFLEYPISGGHHQMQWV
jgi:hypothetical protein